MTKLGKDLLAFIEQVDDLKIDDRESDNISFNLKGLDADTGASWGYYDDAANEIRLDKKLKIVYSLTLKEKPQLQTVNATCANCITCHRIKDFKKLYYITKQTMLLYNEFAKKLENQEN